jgi:methylenetetrahydrofolate dehydrogenase (NADP+)/methenyltetrahydrofolate cyclohydrolase
MIIDGKAIAQEILQRVRIDVQNLQRTPVLTVFTCVPNFETQKFLALKQKRADEVGIKMEVISLNPVIPIIEMLRTIEEALLEADGVIVQLPFPPAVDIATILAGVPAAYDVDALLYAGQTTTILPPVVGAIDMIAQKYELVWKDKKVVVVGQGRLVGAPAALYAENKGADVTIVGLETSNNEDKIKEADILILGAGVPGLVTASMVKTGVVVFDAGTSEEGGMLVGDAAPAVAEKAELITPVPGGIGPITIAVLLHNLVALAKNK